MDIRLKKLKKGVERATRLYPPFDKGDCVVSASPNHGPLMGISVVIADGEKDDTHLAREVRAVVMSALPPGVAGTVYIPKSCLALSPDLAVAVLLLEVSGLVRPGSAASATFMGRIRLDGSIVEPHRGAFAALMTARNRGVGMTVVGSDGRGGHGPLEQVGLGSTIHRVKNMKELIELLQHPLKENPIEEWEPPVREPLGADDELPNILRPGASASVRGAVQSAIHHQKNILFVGPPGCGATMYARRIRHYLPLLDRAAYLQMKRVHSAAGIPIDASAERPFRAPHHTASLAAFVGKDYRPGEIALAHGGVLFLDELLEFRAGVIEAVANMLDDPNEKGSQGEAPAIVVASMRPDELSSSAMARRNKLIKRLNFEVINLEPFRITT